MAISFNKAINVIFNKFTLMLHSIGMLLYNLPNNLKTYRKYKKENKKTWPCKFNDMAKNTTVVNLY